MASDVAALRAVFRAASLSNDRDREHLLANPEALEWRDESIAEGRTLAAEVERRVVGFATWRLAGAGAELDDLFVDPGWMRRGIGTSLVQAVAGELRGRGVRDLEVTANPEAMGFYRSAGFVEIGVDAETRFGPAPRLRLAL